MRRSLVLVPLFLAACASAGGGGAPPLSFVRSTSDARTTRLIEVREGIARAAAMRAVTEALAQRYTVEVTDARAGFVMTGWQASIMKDGVPDLRYRTRLTAKFIGDDWRRLQVRDEANWANGDEWDVGFDGAQLDSVASELHAKLGKR